MSCTNSFHFKITIISIKNSSYICQVRSIAIFSPSKFHLLSLWAFVPTTWTPFQWRTPYSGRVSKAWSSSSSFALVKATPPKPYFLLSITTHPHLASTTHEKFNLFSHNYILFFLSDTIIGFIPSLQFETSFNPYLFT